MSIKTAKLVLATIIAGFILATVHIFFLILDRQEMLREVARYNISWLASQAVVELTRLEQRISAFGVPGSTIEKVEVDLRLDVLLNRMVLLQNGEFQRFLSQDLVLENLVKEADAAVASAQPIIAHLEEPGAVLRALAHLAPVAAKLNELSSAANHYSAKRVADEQRNLLELHSLFTLVAAGLIAGGISLVLLLGWHNQLLVRARAELGELTRDLQIKTGLLETTLETIDQGLIMVDASDTVQIYNSRALEILNLPKALMDSKPSLEALWQLQRDGGHEGVPVGASNSALPADLKGVRLTEHGPPAGTIIEVRTVPLPSGGGVYTYTDTTARRAAELAKNNFLSTMSHEIRTPLTGLLGMSDLLQDEQLTARQHAYLDAIRDSGRHLLAVVNDVLDFSRIEAGKVELEQTRFHINSVLEQVEAVMAPQAAGRGLELHCSIAESLPAVMGDPTRLSQVLINLVSNGLKFTDSGEVSVAVSWVAEAKDRVSVRFSVRDTGIGIPDESRAQLFNAFVQIDNSATRPFGGSGLGLVISQRLIHAMGSSINFESVLGVGSHFWFELWLEKSVLTVPVPSTVSTPLEGPPVRVLVAEDVAINRELLGQMLKRRGHTVLFAENGFQAVEQAERESIDVVLMDVHMPVMDGLEATRRIRQLQGSRGRVRIVAVTANVVSSERDRYLAAGMDACVTKPIDWIQLFSALRLEMIEAPGSCSEPQLGVTGSPAVLNRKTLEQLSLQFSSEDLSSLLESAVQQAMSYCEKLRNWGGTTDGLVVGEAHSLKGTCGLFGLSRLSAIAGKIEIAAKDGHDLSDLLAEFCEALGATGAELERSGLLSKRLEEAVA